MHFAMPFLKVASNGSHAFCSRFFPVVQESTGQGGMADKNVGKAAYDLLTQSATTVDPGCEG